MPRTAPALKLHSHNSASALTMVIIYGVVTGVLLVLVRISRGGLERLYFACCASSATFGLLRLVFGDPPLHVAQYMRIAMLVCAAVVGTIIVRMHADVLVAE
ncbi:MAG TPA: hypothetical protein VD837_05145 [Terriglobales bacterium]|nr:hypothetical protein [Terriglobales bacterium]